MTEMLSYINNECNSFYIFFLYKMYCKYKKKRVVSPFMFNF